jgi:Putative MetA-pathway of phenol degradation
MAELAEWQPSALDPGRRFWPRKCALIRKIHKRRRNSNRSAAGIVRCDIFLSEFGGEALMAMILRGSARLVSRWARSLAGSALAVIPAVALAQQAQVSMADSAADQLRQDQRPAPEGDVLAPMSLFQLYFAVKTAPGSGSNGSIRTVTTDTFKLRADTRIDLTPDWQLALRGDLPFLAKNPLNSSNPNADYLYGVGDADVQAALIHDIDARWKAGFSARLFMPTGDDNLGSGKWQIMPIVGARYSMPDVGSGMYFEPLLRYDLSFAGDPSRKSISNLQFAPTVNFSFPGGWFFALYPNPDIRWNFGPTVTGQTGRLFLPFDGRLGRKFTKTLTVSLEVGIPIINQYPVYDLKTELRVNVKF